MIKILLFLLIVILLKCVDSSLRTAGFRKSLITPLATLLDINLSQSIDVESKETRRLSSISTVPSISTEVKDHNALAYRVKDRGSYISTDHIPQPARYETRDWLHNLLNIHHSTVLKEIRGVILACTLWSTFVAAAHKVLKFTSFGMRSHSLLGGALGLLLVFRTNSSYARFWEGRKILERIITSSRKLSSIFVNYQSVLDPSKIDRVLHLIAAFPYVIEQHLKGCNNDDFKTENSLSEILSVEEIDQLRKVKNRPLYIISKISKEITEIEEKQLFTNRERQLMQTYCDELCNCLGSAERIVQTPVPLTYARHTSRFLSLFLLSLPVALVGEMGAAVIPFTCFATWSLFGILQIGYMIEDPFKSNFDFEIFSKTIREDIIELLYINNFQLKNPLTM